MVILVLGTSLGWAMLLVIIGANKASLVRLLGVSRRKYLWIKETN
jgi:hypothetical protein